MKVFLLNGLVAAMSLCSLAGRSLMEQGLRTTVVMGFSANKAGFTD